LKRHIILWDCVTLFFGAKQYVIAQFAGDWVGFMAQRVEDTLSNQTIALIESESQKGVELFLRLCYNDFPVYVGF
jgi:hypothetical protein